MEDNKEYIFGKAIGLIIHDIRNYLNTIIGFSSILQSDSDLNNENKGFISKISQAGTLIEKFLSCIDDYIASEDEIEANEIDVKEEINKSIKLTEDFYYEKEIKIENLTEENINITTSQLILNKIIENLFGFSVKGLRGKEDRCIQVYCKEKENGFILYYSDTSNPIFIENDYFSFDEVLNSKRGLYVLFVKKYVSMLGGEIKYLSGNKWNGNKKIIMGNHGFEISIPNFE